MRIDPSEKNRADFPMGLDLAAGRRLDGASVLSEALRDDLAVVGDAGGQSFVVEDVVVAVEWDATCARLGAVAEEGEAGRHAASQDTEVLAGHDRLGSGVDTALAEGSVRGPTGDVHAPGVVDGGGELVGVGDLDRGAVGRRDTVADLANAPLQELLDLGVEAACVARDSDVGGDCVAGAVRSQFGAGEHRRTHGVDTAGDDVLERENAISAPMTSGSITRCGADACPPRPLT